MRTIKIRITQHHGGSIEKNVDYRIWAAYQRTTRRTANNSKWSDNAGDGSATLSQLHDAKNCEKA